MWKKGAEEISFIIIVIIVIIIIIIVIISTLLASFKNTADLPAYVTNDLFTDTGPQQELCSVFLLCLICFAVMFVFC